MEWLGTFVQAVGVPVALTVFFVWQGSVREKRMADRIDQLENYIKDDFAELTNRAEDTIARNTMVIEKTTQVMERIDQHLIRIEARQVGHMGPTT